MQNDRHESTSYFYGSRHLKPEIIQILQLHSQQHGDVKMNFSQAKRPPRVNFKFYNRNPRNMGIFQDFTEIQNDRHGSALDTVKFMVMAGII